MGDPPSGLWRGWVLTFESSSSSGKEKKVGFEGPRSRPRGMPRKGATGGIRAPRVVARRWTIYTCPSCEQSRDRACEDTREWRRRPGSAACLNENAPSRPVRSCGASTNPRRWVQVLLPRAPFGALLALAAVALIDGAGGDASGKGEWEHGHSFRSATTRRARSAHRRNPKP